MAKPVVKSKMQKVMHEFKTGTLHAGIDPKGPKKAKVVKSRKQAIAIAMAQSGQSKNGNSMSVKGEKYASPKAKAKHEKGEGFKERMMEYGKKKSTKKVAKKVVKKVVKRPVARGR